VTRPSSIALRIAVGEQVLAAVLAGEPCPLCKRPTGDHAADCVVGKLILTDEVVRRMAARAKEEKA
jgi:hypothetical protein